MAVDISIIVPVYRSANILADLHERVVSVMESEGNSFELVLVDDCSPDNSWAVISQLAQEDARVTGIQLMRNYGQACATLAGLQAAHGDVIVTMDDDLQNPPEEIAKLLSQLENDASCDVAIGVPRTKQHARWRNWASRMVDELTSKVFATQQRVTMTSFRAMRREVVEPLFDLNTSEPAPGTQLFGITQRMTSIPVKHDPRHLGSSGYNLRKMLRLTSAKFLGYTAFPLRALALIGFFGVIVSILLALVFLVRYLTGSVAVPGWTTIVLLVVFTSGFNFLALGIIGEYLFQIFKSARRLPPYVVRQTTNPALTTEGGTGAVISK